MLDQKGKPDLRTLDHRFFEIDRQTSEFRIFGYALHIWMPGEERREDAPRFAAMFKVLEIDSCTVECAMDNRMFCEQEQGRMRDELFKGMRLLEGKDRGRMFRPIGNHDIE